MKKKTKKYKNIKTKKTLQYTNKYQQIKPQKN